MNRLSGIRTQHFQGCSDAATPWKGTASFAKSIGNSTGKSAVI